jgi:hypothetical protein
MFDDSLIENKSNNEKQKSSLTLEINNSSNDKNNNNYKFLIFRGEKMSHKNEKLEFYFKPNNCSSYGSYINPKNIHIFGNKVESLKNKKNAYSSFL